MHIDEADLTLTTELLGTGRFGDVLFARWLESPVACKRILPAAETTVAVRARLESEVASLVVRARARAPSGAGPTFIFSPTPLLSSSRARSRTQTFSPCTASQTGRTAPSTSFRGSRRAGR